MAGPVQWLVTCLLFLGTNLACGVIESFSSFIYILGLSRERERESYNSLSSINKLFPLDKPKRSQDQISQTPLFIPAGHHTHSSNFHLLSLPLSQLMALLSGSLFTWPRTNSTHYGVFYAAIYITVVARKPPDKMSEHHKHVINDISPILPTISRHEKRRPLRGRFHMIPLFFLFLSTIVTLSQQWGVNTATWNPSSSTTSTRRRFHHIHWTNQRRNVSMNKADTRRHNPFSSRSTTTTCNHSSGNAHKRDINLSALLGMADDKSVQKMSNIINTEIAKTRRVALDKNSITIRSRAYWMPNTQECARRLTKFLHQQQKPRKPQNRKDMHSNDKRPFQRS